MELRAAGPLGLKTESVTDSRQRTINYPAR
jgi:hypothetical protein